MAWGAPAPGAPAVVASASSFLSAKLLTTFLIASASSSGASLRPAAASAAASTRTGLGVGVAAAPIPAFQFNRSLSAVSIDPSGRSLFESRGALRSGRVPAISHDVNSRRQRVVSMATNDAAASAPKIEKSDAEWRTILSPEQFRILRQKGTEWAGTGKYDKFYEDGLYECAACSTPLYKSTTKFKSGCGWPAFFEGLPGAITETADADGRRIEITCTACGGHLGHTFKGEGFPTPTDERHCVNSISLKFTPGGK